MSFSFPSVEDAVRNGFIPAAARHYVTYRGCAIIAQDTSGRGARGYSFGLRVEIPDEFTINYLGVLSDETFGSTVEVQIFGASPEGSLTSNGQGFKSHTHSGRNRTILMFEPKTYEEAVQGARYWTDKWFRAHPGAMIQANEKRLLKRRA